MLEELTRNTGAGVWAIASMLFFLTVWAVVAVRTFRARPEELDALARMPLADDDNGPERLRGDRPAA